MNQCSNINLYLSQSHVLLDESNYNEVDALVFAQLTYFPFEKVWKEYLIKRISIPEYAKTLMKQPDFLSVYSYDEQIFVKELILCNRYRYCFVHDIRAVATKDSQWAAITIDIDNSGTSVIAMRGTDGTTIGWEENLRLAYQVIGTGAQLESFRYIKNSPARKLYLTGHSKGGSNICSAYVMSNPYVRDKVVRIDNFDGPGVNPEFAGHYADGYRELEGKLNNFYPKDSIIGQLLQDHPGRHFYVQTEVREEYEKRPIIGQHDPFAAIVKGNEFLKAEQTNQSKMLNDVIDDFMIKTTNIQRYYLVQLMHRIGLPDLISGENGRGINEVSRLLCGLIKASPEEKQILFELICSFLKSLMRGVKEWIAQQDWKGYNKSNVLKAQAE